MGHFEYSSKEHKDWLSTRRTHEECADCRYQYVKTPPRKTGHVSGPVHCANYEEKLD
jgi:hypothetical protein